MGQSEKVLAKPMRHPGAGVVSGGVPLLNSGPELEPPPSSIIASDTAGEGGRNMI